jgi:serine-type D-Ala-D-Ala carboxypeptidase/endopeptidase (penicillin-binding protein 4)
MMCRSDYSGADLEGVVTGVSDVTKRTIIGLVGVLVVAAVAVVVSLTVLRPGPQAPIARPSLISRVPGAVMPVEAGDVLPAAGTDAPVPSATALRKVLGPLIASRALGSSVSVDVLDPLTGEHLLTSGQGTPRTPASTAKLLTSAAALSLLGPQTTLATTVVAGKSAGQLVLVGGGDVLLTKGAGDPDAVNGRAGLTTLARQTAESVRAQDGSAQGGSKVTLTLDDRLFSGPARAPRWDTSDIGDGFVAPIYPLEIDTGRVNDDHYAQRSSDPAMAVARTFAGLLKKQGLQVSGSVRRGAAPAGAAELGRVESAPVAGLVEYALTESDNTVAETLGRLVAAKAGKPASFVEVGPAVLAENKKLGVPVTGAELVDGSGLSDGSKVPALALTELLALATDADHPQLRPILSGLPVAAVSGTLLDRFARAGDRAATGAVRAKTGTLTGASSLAGTVVDADGRLLVFAAMADQVTSTTSARNALDSLASTLATCGCR